MCVKYCHVLLKDNDRFLGANPKTSTRFDRNFSIAEYLKVNLGAEKGIPLVSAVKINGNRINRIVFRIYRRAAPRAHASCFSLTTCDLRSGKNVWLLSRRGCPSYYYY